MASPTGSGPGNPQKPPEKMRRVDFSRDDLSVRDKEYMDKMTGAHRKNVDILSRSRYVKRNSWMALALGASALSVYAYSIYSVSQESFLEDLDTPNKSS